MEAEFQQFDSERAERVRILHDKHQSEIEAFDEESIRKGFRYLT